LESIILVNLPKPKGDTLFHLETKYRKSLINPENPVCKYKNISELIHYKKL
jgi:hypothetical protein